MLREVQCDKKGHFSSIRARARGQRTRRHERRELKKRWLKSFFYTRNISKTCKQLHMSRTSFYGWLQRDAAFKEKYDDLCALFWPPPRQYTPSETETVNPWEHASDRAIMTAYKRLRCHKW